MKDTSNNNNNLIEVSSVTQNYVRPDGQTQRILEKIDFNLKSGEILAILGKSGCGKSTLLKIIAGLMPPTRGKVRFNYKENDKAFGISMIFQSFALFPWLTVLENVELGMEALNISYEKRRQRALEAINLIGLDGFESAMPRELSGGMKQRVGFARALVVGSEVLLMDEPFSALDILTSGALKRDFLELWRERKTDVKSVIIVTHSIEEAVMMADRAIILAPNPGRIITEIKINLKRPRSSQSVEFREMVDKIYSAMSAAAKVTNERKKRKDDITSNLILASPNQLEAIAGALISPPHNGSGDLADLAKSLHLRTFELIHISEALTTLKFASVTDSNIALTNTGRAFAKSSVEDRKTIFAKALLVHVPLASYIVNILNERSDNTAPRMRFQTRLEDQLSYDDAASALKAIILAGRYAEIFSYDDTKQMFSLDNPV